MVFENKGKSLFHNARFEKPERISNSAHAWSENGVKWFLFSFFDLGATLRFTALFRFFAVSTLFKSA
jgi:hypothetical protein